MAASSLIHPPATVVWILRIEYGTANVPPLSPPPPAPAVGGATFTSVHFPFRVSSYVRPSHVFHVHFISCSFSCSVSFHFHFISCHFHFHLFFIRSLALAFISRSLSCVSFCHPFVSVCVTFSSFSCSVWFRFVSFYCVLSFHLRIPFISLYASFHFSFIFLYSLYSMYFLSFPRHFPQFSFHLPVFPFHVLQFSFQCFSCPSICLQFPSMFLSCPFHSPSFVEPRSSFYPPVMPICHIQALAVQKHSLTFRT